MQIQISSVSPVRVEGKFPKIDIKYFRDGKSTERTLAGVGKTKDVINILKEAKENDIYDIELEKKGEYYNWVGATKAVAQAAAEQAKSSYQTKSTYETPEERAKKQVYIVRQSSITNAIEYLNDQSKKFSVSEVLDVAEQFVQFVFNGREVAEENVKMERATKLAEKGMATVEDEFKDDNPF